MLIGEPMPSQYDWRFRLWGIPIRVTWLFWVIAAALGYSLAMSVDDGYQMLARARPEFSSPGFPALLGVWVAATLVSLIVHEFGHSLAFRFYGIDSQIVLYHMGGLAIPTAGFVYRRGGSRSRLTDLNQIIISAAGPGLQLASGLLVGIVAMYFGIRVDAIVDLLESIVGLLERFGIMNLLESSGVMDLLARLGWDFSFANAPMGETPKSALTYALVEFYVLISIWWPLFNLLPVYPLDGGHIIQHAIAIVRRTDGMYEANVIGAIVGFAVAFWFFRSGSVINSLLFVSLAMSNVQALQQRQ